MPTISGNVVFNGNNSAPTTGTPVANIPVVLRSSSGIGMAVRTDSGGNFVFNNVPNGTYTLVESWGTSITITPSPGNFGSATSVAAPIPTDPPISAIPGAPSSATAVQSLSPNTINLSVSGNVANLTFIDGPIRDIPISALDITPLGPNLVTNAANGTFGSLSPGSSVDSSPSSAPYPSVTPGFTYVQSSSSRPVDGQYTITNINTLRQFGTWFAFADHTTRDETGRVQIVNGANPGAIVFTQNITVNPNSYLLTSVWIMNILSGGALPQLGVRLRSTSGTVIYNQVLSNIQSTSDPVWRQEGTLLFTGSNTSLVYEIYSNGPAAGGNDYAIDDVVIQNANLATIANITKSVDKNIAGTEDILTYTSVITNTGQSTATNIKFLDTIPSGTSFIPGSVLVNGVTVPSADPTPPGFTISSPSSLVSGSSMTVTFKVMINSIPNTTTIINSSIATYDFIPIPGGSTINQSLISNEVITNINSLTVTAVKFENLSHVTLGDIIDYTILLNTTGTTFALNAVFIDTIPNGTTLVSDSVVVNGASLPGATPNPPLGVAIGTLPVNTITTITFKVLVNTIPSPNPIPNSGYVRYQYRESASSTIVNTKIVDTNSVEAIFNVASLKSLKSVNKKFTGIGDTLTYTISITNTGNTTANNILFIDTIPQGTSVIGGTLNQDGVNILGNTNPPGVTLPNSIGPNKTSTITFQVTIVTIPSINPIPNSAFQNYNYIVDPSTTPNRVKGDISQTNIVNTLISNANLTSVKYTDKAYAKLGDTITYTIAILNTGNVDAKDIFFKDTIPQGTIFINNTFAVNGSPIIGGNPSLGVTIPDIPGGVVSTITFKVNILE